MALFCVRILIDLQVSLGMSTILPGPKSGIRQRSFAIRPPMSRNPGAIQRRVDQSIHQAEFLSSSANYERCLYIRLVHDTHHIYPVPHIRPILGIPTLQVSMQYGAEIETRIFHFYFTISVLSAEGWFQRRLWLTPYLTNSTTLNFEIQVYEP